MAIVIGVALLVACGGDPSSPSRPDMAGTYQLTTLRFDPQGVLPEVDLLDRLGTDVQLILTADGRAQLLYQDPGSGLVSAVEGSYSTPASGARLHFTAGEALRRVLIPSRLTYDHAPAAGTLSYQGEAPDGLDRARLLSLVPEWSDEQLLSPVPGSLTIIFTSTAAVDAE